MSDRTETYVIRRREPALDNHKQFIYDVYADTSQGLVDFCKNHSGDMSPASTVEIDDTKCIMRLRIDGTWTIYQTTGETEDGTDPAQAAEDAAVASFLDDLVSDAEMEDYLESEVSA